MRTSPTLIAFPKDGNLYTERLYAEVESQGFAVVEGVWSWHWLAGRVRRGDLIHIHWPSFLYHEPGSRLRTGWRLLKLYALLAWAKRRGATLLWTAHNLYPHDGGASGLHRLGRRIIVHFADVVFAHGQSAGTIAQRVLRVPPARLRIGHHAHWIDCYPNTLSREECRRRLGIAPDEFLYLHIGRCRPYKGLEPLIEAFGTLAAPSRLLIAGKFSSPAYEASVTALAASRPRIDIVARSIEVEEMQVYLNAADCVVLPYRAVLTSGTALLALSFGRPVIAPDLGALRDHVDTLCGILYDPEAPDALPKALVDIRSRRYDTQAIIERTRRHTWAHLATLVTSSRVAPT